MGHLEKEQNGLSYVLLQAKEYLLLSTNAKTYLVIDPGTAPWPIVLQPFDHDDAKVFLCR